MNDCIECGKKLGILEGYRHPILGKEHLLCSDCFDSVSMSVEKWGEVISSYTGFFSKETSNHMKKMQKSRSTLWSDHDYRTKSDRNPVHHSFDGEEIGDIFRVQVF